MRFDFTLNRSAEQIMRDAGINENTLMFAAEESRRFMDGYVPMDTGALAENTIVSAGGGKGCVSYTQSYAAVCYYGESRNFSSEKHQMATAFWDKAMMQTHKNELAANIEAHIKGAAGGE